MKISHIISQCAKGTGEGKSVHWVAHKGQEIIIFNKCAAYYVPKGTSKKIKEAAADKALVVKADGHIKAISSLKDYSMENEDLFEAKLTGKEQITDGQNLHIVQLMEQNSEKEKWINVKLIEGFGARRKFYFRMDGWHEREVFVSENGVLKGVIFRIKPEVIKQ